MLMKRKIKKRYLIPLIAFAVLLVALVLANFWIERNATAFLHNVVAEKSGGRYDLEIDKLTINYFKKRVELNDFRLNILDSAGRVKHIVKTNYFVLELNSLLHMLQQKQMIVDSIVCDLPYIELSGKEKKKGDSLESASVTFEIGSVYNVVKGVLDELQVKNLRIREGSIKINPFQKGDRPVALEHINFSIKNFGKGADAKHDSARVLFADDISLKTYDQHIIFPDNVHTIDFSSISISTLEKKIIVDSFLFKATSKDSSQNAMTLFVEELKLVNTQFADLYLREFIKADSIVCVNPDIKLTIDQTQKKEKEKPKEKAKLTEAMVKQMLGNIDVQYIGVLNADFSVRILQKDKEQTRTANGNSFEIHRLYVDNTTDSPIYTEHFRIAFREYKTWLPDSMHIVSFDSLVYDKPDIVLKNLRIEPSPKNDLEEQSFISIPELEISNFDPRFAITDNIIKADMARLIQPRILLYANPDKKKPAKQTEKKSLATLLSAAKGSIDIEQFELIGANVFLKPASAAPKTYSFTNVNTIIKVSDLLAAENISQVESAIQLLSFQKASLELGNTTAVMNNGILLGSNNEIYADNIQINSGDGAIKVSGIKPHITGLMIDEVAHTINVDSITWNAATIQYKKPVNQTAAKPKEKTPPAIHADYIHLKNTRFSEIAFGTNTISTLVNELTIQELRLSEEAPLHIGHFSVNGSNLIFAGASVAASMKQYNLVNNKNSSLTGVEVKYRKQNNTATIRLPAVELLSLMETGEGNTSIKLKHLGLINPVIQASIVQQAANNTSGKQSKEKKASPLQLEQISCKGLEADINLFQQSGNMHFNTAKTDFNISGIGSGEEGFAVEDIQFSLHNFSVNNHDSILVQAPKGNMTIAAKNVFIPASKGKAGGRSLEGLITAFDVAGLSLTMHSRKGGDPLTVADLQAKAGNIQLKGASAKSIMQTALKYPGLGFSSSALHLPLGKSTLELDQLKYRKSELQFEAMRMIPVVDKDSFMKMQEWQTDYLQLSAGPSRISGIREEKFINDSMFSAHAMHLNGVQFAIYKDKRLPFKYGVIKPLPVNLLKKIPIPLELDSIYILDASIAYTEFNDKTGKEALIYLNGTDAIIKNVHNSNFSGKDSLLLLARTNLMDSIHLRFRFAESYIDTLAGFLMHLRARPFDIAVMNPVLIPLASVKIKSGRVDTLQLKAIGREYIALGAMDMYYHDLKVEFLKNAEESKKTILTGLVSVVANFAVKNKNTDHTGTIFFERIRERSFVNYWLKIAISGMVTSVGAKNNKKAMKKYNEAIKRLHLPDIQFEY